MTIDDQIQRAIQIGERNKRIITLANNWCSHIEIERRGGTGLVEIQTGLPIGMRSFKCKHASAAGMAGMDLETVALDFYDRNCSNCKQRVPVRLPNLSELVAERDVALQRTSAARTLATEAASQALASRETRRDEISKGCNPSQAGVLESLDAFDRDPSNQNRLILLQTAAAVPGQFDSAVQEAVYDLAEAGGSIRAEAALEVLTAIAGDHKRLCEMALRALGRHDAYSVAAAIVAKHLSKDHEHLIPAALPNLMALARPVNGFPGPRSPGDPKALLATHRLFPEVVLQGVRNQLQTPHKYTRIVACNAISLIIKIDDGFGMKVVEDLLRSLDLPDDPYGEEGSADAAFATTLADIMITHPDQVDALIQTETQSASAETRSTLLAVYQRVLRRGSRFDDDEQREVGRAEELSYQRMVDLISNRVENERFRKATLFIRDSALDFPDLFEKHAETLLGAAALIAGELETPQSPLLDLSIEPDFIKQLEKQGRHDTLSSALDGILRPIGVFASQKPESLGKLVLTTLQAVGEGHEYFKYSLVKCLGFVASTPSGLALAIPALYQAMTHSSTLVRAASAYAYSQLSKHDPEDLPSLVHESFMLLLLDPYVIVHTAAVDALDKVTLPTRYTQRVIQYLANLVQSYRSSRSNDEILSACLERMLELLESPPDRFREVVLSIIGNMKASAASRFIVHNRVALRGTAGFGKLLLRLLGDTDVDSYIVGDLVSELRRVKASEILNISDDFRAAARLRDSQGMNVTDEFIEILTAAGAWGVAVDIARDATGRLSDNLWDRPRKLQNESRQVAAELEAAAARADLENIRELMLRWRVIEEKMREDDEEHKKKRDTLFGIPFPDTSH
jgi:hypothetical protein